MENENGVNLKVAVLTEKVDNMEDQILHKLRNQEQQVKYVYDEIIDIQNKLKLIAVAATTAFALTQGGAIEFLKSLM